MFGRWDETKGEDNIDFMPTILSRFDMIFIVKDEHNEERDVVSQGCRVHGAPLQPGPWFWGRANKGLGMSPDHRVGPVVGYPGGGRWGLQRALNQGAEFCLPCE